MINTVLFDSAVTEPVEGSWWDKTMSAFMKDWWVFVVTLGAVIIGMIIVHFLTKGKIFKFRTIFKVLLNCIISFVLLFIINTMGGVFTAGAFSMTLKWYSWPFIGIFGLLGLIFLIISIFAFPDIFVTVT